MKCPQCNVVEMMSRYFYGDKFTFVCPKCKLEKEVTEEELLIIEEAKEKYK